MNEYKSEFGQDVERFIELTITLMEAGNWTDFYRLANEEFTVRSIHRLNELLLAAEIDPVEDLHYVPENFLRNASLTTEYNIPETCKEIRDKAFSHSGLKTITIPESVELLGKELFYNCYQLKECIIKTNKIPQLPDGTFDYCTQLKRLVLPKDFKHFDTDALGNVYKDRGLVIEFDGTQEEFMKILHEGFYDAEFTVKCTDETFNISTGDGLLQ